MFTIHITPFPTPSMGYVNYNFVPISPYQTGSRIYGLADVVISEPQYLGMDIKIHSYEIAE